MPVSLDVSVSICKVSSNKYSANLSLHLTQNLSEYQKKNAYKIHLNLEYFLNGKNKQTRKSILINKLNKDNLQISLNKFDTH